MAKNASKTKKAATAKTPGRTAEPKKKVITTTVTINTASTPKRP